MYIYIRTCIMLEYHRNSKVAFCICKKNILCVPSRENINGFLYLVKLDDMDFKMSNYWVCFKFCVGRTNTVGVIWRLSSLLVVPLRALFRVKTGTCVETSTLHKLADPASSHERIQSPNETTAGRGKLFDVNDLNHSPTDAPVQFFTLKWVKTTTKP
jgi:hypothetical protein